MKTIVFDFDGTLTKKSHEIWYKMWKAIDALDVDYMLYKKYKNNEIDYIEWCIEIEKEYKKRGFNQELLFNLAEGIELMDNLEETLKILKEKGYNIILLNFRNPQRGNAWNPLTLPYRLYKSGNQDKAIELLDDLALNILYEENNGNADPFWEKTSADYFSGLALGMFEDTTEDKININSINMMAEVGEDRIGASNYIKEYFKSKGELSPAYIAAASCINAPNETRGGIMSTFRTKTRIFSSQVGLSEMLSYSDFDIRDIGKEKTAVFLKVHDEKTTYHALATIFVKQAYEALISVAQTCPGLKLPYRTNFILDEFANMPALKDVGTMITASRSRNIRFSFAIQNFSQLNQGYGKEVAETIKGNCGNFVYIMSTELAALEEISKLLGDKKPEEKKDKPSEPIRPLFSVSDLQALKENEVIFNRFRSMPFKTKLTPNWKIDWGKKYEQMGYSERENREVRVFDLKGFVAKLKEEQGQPIGSMPGGPGMMGGMMGGLPNPFMNPMGPVPGGARSAGVMPTSLDDYVRRLDEKIAELEREEAEEKARMEKEKQAKENKIIDVKEESSKQKTEEELQKEITDILEHKADSKKEEKQELPKEDDFVSKFVIPNEFIKEEIKEEPIKEESFTQQPTYEEIEKPKVNVDIDSVVIQDNPSKDDDFFDDFFGTEDE